MSTPLPEYAAPPLDEVVIGITFAPLSSFKMPHIGLFWQKISDEFPKCEHAPIVGPIDQIIDNATGTPLPRIWFINNADDLLVQLQANKLLLNWRKRDVNYPRFVMVYSKFNELLNIFSEFLSAHYLGDIDFRQAELSYHNYVEKHRGWDSLDNISDILPSLNFSPKATHIAPIEGLYSRTVHKMKDNEGILSILIRNGERAHDKVSVLNIEIQTQCDNTSCSLDSIDDWFKKSHEAIVRSFADITSEDVQNKIWRKKT